MTDPRTCFYCHAALAPDDAYCAGCGSTTGRVRWSLSVTRQPAAQSILLHSGGSFFAVASNVGLAPVRVEVDGQRADGVELIGVSSGFVAPGQCQAFEVRHRPGEEIGGALVLRSRDGRREQWWERWSWRPAEVRLAEAVRVRDDRWVCGAPVVVFPPDVRRQVVRIWNDSERQRTLKVDSPVGYRVLNAGNPAEPVPSQIGPGSSFELALQALPPGQNGKPDAEWIAVPDCGPIPLTRLDAPLWAVGPDAVIAIDFGTCNTGVHVRWRRTLAATKPSGATDAVCDRSGRVRFPSCMVLDRKDRRFLWGSEAEAAISANRLGAEEFAVENLKTYLRRGEEAFVRHEPAWTNEALLKRFFEQVFSRIDRYFQTADPGLPLTRTGLRLRYVLTRPVLDANDGDGAGKRYEQALLAAMAVVGVPEQDVTFVHEPVAAAIGIAKRREQELLGLDGQAISIIDAGGGTTDVALARVRLRDGRVGLDIVGSYALNLSAENPVVPTLKWFGVTDRTEIGGNVIDYALTVQMAARPAVLLETEGRPVPAKLDSFQLRDSKDPSDRAALNRPILNTCRTIKEHFAGSSREYLNRPKSAASQQTSPGLFPTHPEFEGVYIEHSLVDEKIYASILDPVVGELSQRMGLAQASDDGVRPSQVRRVFYVGGTNIDGFIRRRFARAFSAASAETDADAQSPERIAERLSAVVEGAVWFDEQLFAQSPLTLTVRMGNLEEVLVAEGAALLPLGMARPRFLTVVLEPMEGLSASLVAAGPGLDRPVTVANGFYRNETDAPEEVTLRVSVSRERGAVASLAVGSRALDQWQFALLGQRA